jgi:hypothetical protein
MTYLTEAQIDAMADAALTTFEVSADRAAAQRAAAEFAVDEFGVTPRKSAVLLALKRAGLAWEARKMATRRIVGGRL